MKKFLSLFTIVFALHTIAEDPNTWLKLDESKTGERAGSTLVYAADSKQFILTGTATNAAAIQAFDPAKHEWTDLAATTPAKEFHPYYQTAYDPVTKTIFCLSGGMNLYQFNTVEKSWKTRPAEPQLEKLSWQTLAIDPVHRKLVVVGSDKRADNLGWTRTVVYDIDAGAWTTLPVPDLARKQHQDLVESKERMINAIGRIRLAWFRDPKGRGSDAELGELLKFFVPPIGDVLPPFSKELTAIHTQLVDRNLLAALKQARALQRHMEELAEDMYPVPPSRRNSPLAFDEKNNVFILFGGDHEDYLMNDTWILDLAKNEWRRAKPDLAPSPRAGHALCALPQAGGVALYEGYLQNSSEDYGARAFQPIDPLQLWRFDPKTERWELHVSAPISAAAANQVPVPTGNFYSYTGDKFSPPALAADTADNLILIKLDQKDSGGKLKRPSQTWTLHFDATKFDAASRTKLGAPPNQRQYRTGEFLAAFCEVADAPKDTGLDSFVENRWTKLPAPPRNPCRGCRQRDWGTSVWDSDRDQILLWGGGHCVRSSSSVAHYSPASGRTVESYDAEETYGGQGGGGFDSTLLNRPWVSVHNYAHYAYDPVCKLLVSGRGYLYDPARMDWLRLEPIPLPYKFEWGSTVVKSSAHGAVAWARKKSNPDEASLWLFDREKGWQPLDVKGKFFVPWCDSSGMVYDSKRDRMLIAGVKGGYEKLSDGSFLSFDFKTQSLTPVVPDDAEKSRARNSRELAYVEHADCVLIGEQQVIGDKKTGRALTRIYDCAKNKSVLLDAGPVPDGHSVGWMYDAKRKLVYCFTFTGEAWALKLNWETAKLEN